MAQLGCGMFDFSFDPASRILVTTLRGNWTVTDLAAFSAAALARMTAIRLRYGPFAILVDCRDMPVQTNVVATGLEIVRTKASALTPGPIATIASSMLGKMQADRIMKTPQARVFFGIDDANEWLASVWEPDGPATSPRVLA